MSVCVLRLTGQVCDECAKHLVVQSDDGGVLLVAAEANDLHTKCLVQTFFMYNLLPIDTGFHGKMYREVVKKSPWHAQLRWYRSWPHKVRSYLRWHWHVPVFVLALLIMLATIMWGHQ